MVIGPGTLPYLPQVPFSVAYMNLCEWRDAHEASENWLVGIRLMFIHASEASGFLPVAEGHPVLLDASATEVLGDIETSVSPLSLRGFQLHTVLAPLADGSKARNIVSPRLQGGSTSALILYDEETVSPELGPQPPMGISLCAPSQDHWTIVLDTVLPSTIEEYRQLREQATSKPTEAEALPSSNSGNGACRAEAAPSRERTLQMARSRQEGMMRQWATALRQAAYDPSSTGQGSASSTTPLGLHLNYDMEFRS